MLLGTLSLASLGCFGQLGSHGVEPGCQGGKVADGVRVGDGAAQGLDGMPRIIRCQRAGGQPLLQQRDLQIQRLEAAHEEGQRLLCAHIGHLPDDAFAVAGGHVDGAVFLDATEARRSCGVTHAVHLARKRPIFVRCPSR